MKIRKAREKLPKGQTDILEEMGKFSDMEKKRQLEAVRRAQERVFKELGLPKDAELDARMLEIVANRARIEGGGNFARKAAELYTDSFLNSNGPSGWAYMIFKIGQAFREALEEK